MAMRDVWETMNFKDTMTYQSSNKFWALIQRTSWERDSSLRFTLYEEMEFAMALNKKIL